MGLRQALLRWLTSDEQTMQMLDRRARHAAGPQPSTAAPAAGGLVVGSATRRVPPVAVPEFFEAGTETIPAVQPAPADPAPAAAAGTAATGAAAVGVPPVYDPAALQQAFELVRDRTDALVRTFYAELFLRLDDAVLMFPSSMQRQREDFGRALVQWVVADDPEALRAQLAQLGADHRKFDVEPRHYEVAGAALVSAWRKLTADAWNPTLESAVLGSYARLASIMIDGAIRSMHEPASWGAQVLEHHRVLGDFAVLRIQPDAPYPYRAGQYLTLELPSHRRQWRQMSIASAPRPDNTLEIHVRAVGGSGVSAALVAHTRPGDRLTLGPPRGNDLVVEPGTLAGGLLCVASGTGAAPITAVVESVLNWPTPPGRLFAFVGAKTRADAYPVDRLRELVRASGDAPSAQVHAVVSDDPAYTGYRGRVERVVPTLRDWAQLQVDVLIAGPNPMIAATVANLTDAGVPLSRIHFDQYDTAA